MHLSPSSVLWRQLRRVGEELRPSSFRSKQGSVLRSLALLIERLRPNAAQPFASLSQSLYARPTLNWERQTAQLLRQPLAEVQSLLAANRLHNRRFERRRNGSDNQERIRSYCNNIQLPQQEEYLALIRRDDRSRVIASFHCGDFLYGSAKLFRLNNSTRRNLVLSLNRSAPTCFANLSAGYGDEQPWRDCELLLEQCSSIQLSRLLRAGKTSLLLYCDVPPGLNASTQLCFLGRPAWFSIGPAMLALINRVPLLPLINYFDGRQNRVVLAKQIEPERAAAESLRLAAIRMTQQLIDFFEPVFLQHPQQWRFLSLLPAYFSDPVQQRAKTVVSQQNS